MIKLDQARELALRVLQRVDRRYCVAMTIDSMGDHAVSYVIWTTSGGKIHEHKLDTASTDEARLEAHLRGFIENWKHRVL
jgi:hypothetical protein